MCLFCFFYFQVHSNSPNSKLGEDLGHDLVFLLPKHLQVWLTETQESLLLHPVSTCRWWKSPAWLKPSSHDSLAIDVALSVALDQWPSRSPGTFFGITCSQQRFECTAFWRASKNRSRNLHTEFWTSYALSNAQNRTRINQYNRSKVIK